MRHKATVTFVARNNIGAAICRLYYKKFRQPAKFKVTAFFIFCGMIFLRLFNPQSLRDSSFRKELLTNKFIAMFNYIYVGNGLDCLFIEKSIIVKALIVIAHKLLNTFNHNLWFSAKFPYCKNWQMY